jgi:soluble lytic murein transglycosylase
VRLGSAHLSELLSEFDGSYVLAIAAYNAGSKNVRRWLERNGDPRKDPFVDVVDWIELIPLPETRNYVQRILEGLQIYRWQLGQTVVIASIEQDLARGISGSALASRCVPSSSLFDVPVADLAAIC